VNEDQVERIAVALERIAEALEVDYQIPDGSKIRIGLAKTLELALDDIRDSITRNCT
jgi:hypothetical protein